MIAPIMGGVGRANFSSDKFAMVVDGNSISAITNTDMIVQLAALPPISNKLVITNRAISGQNIRDMIQTGSDVDAAYQIGKTNILFVWELTNNIHNIGRTGEQTIADTVEYIAARQAYVSANRPGQKPWTVILATGLPRGDYYGSTFTGPQAELQMQFCNAYIRSNFRQMGALTYVEMRRAGGPFDFTDVTNSANFPSSLWVDRTHPRGGPGAGGAILAGYIADVLKRLPAR